MVCTCIDEQGQARDRDWKLRSATQIHDLAIERYGLEPADLIFDALALTLATGIEESRRDGIETIEGIRLIKENLPGVHTTLGLSNVSFGLNPAARHVLNSVFLHECTQAGLDSAIVHASKILPLNRIPDEQRDVCMDLVYDRRGAEGVLSGGDPNYDPLTKLLDIFADVKAVVAEKEDRSDWTIEQRLSQRIIDGDRDGIEADLDEALAGGITALGIVNDVLLAGMKVVGDLFGSGEMQLPFVLQSAETMKASVAYLEPHMEKIEGDSGKGRIVLATVKGDVHDIGKNLVDIILTNNGYEVHNLGIKVSVSDMITKALEVKADAIGMSGLLVKSTLIMRDNLEELNSRELSNIPVLLGGAALTRSYVERDLREVYQGRLFYGKDAFEGLHVMDRLGDMKRGTEAEGDDDWGLVPSESKVRSRLEARDRSGVDEDALPARSPAVETDNPVYVPPFIGSKVVKGVPLDDIAAYLNETSLFRNQWGFRPEGSHKRGKAALEAGDAISAPTESDEDFKDAHPPRPPRAARPGPRRRPARAHGRLRLLALQRRRQRPGDLVRRRPHRGGHPLLVPPGLEGPVALHRRLLPTRRVGRDRLRGLHDRHDGPHRVRAHRQALRRRPLPGLPPAARPRASRWPRRWPSTGTTASARSWASPTRTAPPSRACSASSTAAAATRGATRPAPTSRTTSGWPSCSAPSASASRSARRPASSTSPSRPRRPSSATTPRPSTSSPGRPGHRTPDACPQVVAQQPDADTQWVVRRVRAWRGPSRRTPTALRRRRCRGCRRATAACCPCGRGGDPPSGSR